MPIPGATHLKRVSIKTLPIYLALIFLVIYARPVLAGYIPGLLLIFLGEGIRIWAAGHLKKTKEVTTTGPYAYVKNPLYLGTFLILVGVCLMAMNFYLLGVGLLVFLIYYVPFKKKREGQRLFERFGQDWVDYDRAVPDYLPRFSRYAGRGSFRWDWNCFHQNSEGGTLLAVTLGVIAISFRF